MKRAAAVLLALAPFGLVGWGVFAVTASAGWACIALGSHVYLDLVIQRGGVK